MQIDPRSAVPCRTVAFSADSRYLVEANYLGFLTVRNSLTGEIEQRYLAQTALVETVRFEANADNLLIVGAGFEGARDFGSVKIIDFSSGQRLAEVSGHSDDITDVVSLPNFGRHIVTVGLDRSVIVHNLQKNCDNWIWDGYTDYLNTCSPRPYYSGQFAVAGDSPFSYVLDACTHTVIAQLETPGDCNGLLWSADGRYLIVGDDHAILQYFDSEQNWKLVETLKTGGAVKRMVADPLNEQRALAACYDGRIWAVPRTPNSPESTRVIVDRRKGLWGINVDATKTRIAVPSFLDRAYLFERDIEGNEGQPIGPEPKPTYGANWIAINNDLEILAVTHDDGCIRLRDLKTGQIKFILGPDSNSLYMGVSFHPILPILATIDFYGQIWLYDIRDGKIIQHFDAGFGPGITIDFSPCGRFLAVGGYRWDAQVFLVNANGEVGKKFILEHPNKGVIKSLCFVDSQRLLTACGDGSGVLHSFDGSDWSAEKSYRSDPPMELCNGVTVDSQGKRGFWVSRDQTLRAFDVETGKCIGTGLGHTRSVKTVAISECNQYLVTGSYDRTVILWDSYTLQAKLPPFRLANSGISCVRIYQEIIYACSFDGYVMAWSVKSGELLWVKSSLNSSQGD